TEPATNYTFLAIVSDRVRIVEISRRSRYEEFIQIETESKFVLLVEVLCPGSTETEVGRNEVLSVCVISIRYFRTEVGHCCSECPAIATSILCIIIETDVTCNRATNFVSSATSSNATASEVRVDITKSYTETYAARELA